MNNNTELVAMAEGINALQGNTMAAAQSGALSKAVSGTTSATSQRDQFLKLLTYQLKAQNPLKPYDNQEFASQLAQFSQLEQLTDIRDMMSEQSQSNRLLTQSLSNLALPGMLGKNAKAFTENVNFDGVSDVNLGYNVAYPAQEGMITIMDGNGTVVRSIELNAEQMKAGDNTFKWDGKNDKGETLNNGNYTFFADFLDTSGNEYSAKTFTSGAIEAVRFKGDGTRLVLAGIEVSLSDVTDIATRN